VGRLFWADFWSEEDTMKTYEEIKAEVLRTLEDLETFVTMGMTREATQAHARIEALRWVAGK
jgi:cob(I)alamin adenosyltransferase